MPPTGGGGGEGVSGEARGEAGDEGGRAGAGLVGATLLRQQFALYEECPVLAVRDRACVRARARVLAVAFESRVPRTVSITQPSRTVTGACVCECVPRTVSITQPSRALSWTVSITQFAPDSFDYPAVPCTHTQTLSP